MKTVVSKFTRFFMRQPFYINYFYNSSLKKVRLNINPNILNAKMEVLSKTYQEETPYPHVRISDFIKLPRIECIASDFPAVTDDVWTHYLHYNERKHGLNKWNHIPKSIQDLISELSNPPFISWLEKLTGIPNLIPDPNLEGGGLHQTLTGGYLNIHADFTVHPRHKNWQRRVNVLIYLNKSWDENWQGNLELWDENMRECVKTISPEFNTAVIFNTGKKTFHGSPNPLNCPKETSRKSLALYYYTIEKKPLKSATNYQGRPNDGFKKTLIWLDKKMISIYSVLKRKMGLSDDFVSSILNKISSNKSK